MVPGLTRNLVLEGWLDNKGCMRNTYSTTKKVYHINRKLCLQGIKEDGLYVWDPNNFAQSFLASTKPQNKMELWHLRMAQSRA